MTNIAFRQTNLEKANQKTFNQSSSSTNATLPSEAINPSAQENCISDQGDRGRVIVFIDGANLFYAASQLSIEIDYVKLLRYLTARDCLVHGFFYTGYEPTDKKQHKFLHWMSHSGFRVIARAVTQAPNSVKRANLDVEIAVDMMRFAQHCDTAVLVSGDGDFTYVVDTIADRGVRVEVVGLRSMTSKSLIEVANFYIDLAAIQKAVQKHNSGVCQQLAISQD